MAVALHLQFDFKITFYFLLFQVIIDFAIILPNLLIFLQVVYFYYLFNSLPFPEVTSFQSSCLEDKSTFRKKQKPIHCGQNLVENKCQ